MTLSTVSVIIPTLNEAIRLPECLSSLQAVWRDGLMLEVIVVDNGSTDGTREIASRYGARCLMDAAANVSGLRNLGVKSASGQMIAFLDADCTVERQWLTAAVPLYARGDVSAWGAAPTIPKKATWVQRAWYLVRRKAAGTHEVPWLESMNLFVRRRQMIQIGGFNENLVSCEDVDLCYRLARFGKIVHDHRIAAVHHGEARTVGEFFRKELWRGRGNLQGLLSHGFVRAELPSLVLPVYTLSNFFLWPVVSLWRGAAAWLIVGLGALFLPGILALAHVWRRGPLIGMQWRLWLLLELYILARTAAIFIPIERYHKRKRRSGR